MSVLLSEIAREFLRVEEHFEKQLIKRGLHSKEDFQLYNFKQADNSQVYIFIPILRDEDECFIYVKDKFIKTVPFSEQLMSDIEQHKLNI